MSYTTRLKVRVIMVQDEIDFVGQALAPAVSEVIKKVNDAGYIVVIGPDQKVKVYKSGFIPVDPVELETPTASKPKRMPFLKSRCSERGCSKPVLSRDLCSIHYARMRRVEKKAAKLAKKVKASPTPPAPAEKPEEKRQPVNVQPVAIAEADLCPRCKTRRKRNGFGQCQPCLANAPGLN